MKRLLLCLIIIGGFVTNSLATYFDTGWIEFKQPDGTTFIGRQQGDEYEYLYLTKEGFPFDENLKDGFYYFAIGVKNNRYDLSSLKVGINLPGNIKKNLVVKTSVQRPEEINEPPLKGMRTSYTLKVVLVDFIDVAGDIAFTKSNFEGMLSGSTYFSKDPHNEYSPNNQYGYGGEEIYGSMSYYYETMSQGNVSINATVINNSPGGMPEWVHLSNNKNHYLTNYTIFTDAENAAVAAGLDVSTSSTTKLVYIYAGNFYTAGLNPRGGGDRYLMYEKWGGTTTYNKEHESDTFGHIGIHCHEFGHLLGLADLYDDGWHKINYWCLMGVGAKIKKGACPAPINPHYRNWQGWITLSSPPIPNSGIALPYNEAAPTIYLAQSGNDKYYVENRRYEDFSQFCLGYDEEGAEGGILVWHSISTHTIDLIEADGSGFGNGGTEGYGDMYPGSTDTRNLNDFTSPADCQKWNGGNSNVILHNISDPAETMTAVFGDKWFGDIPLDLTWNNNIEVGGIMTVPAGLTLTISPESSVNFDPDTRLLINGSIQAIGTDGNRITFTHSGDSGQWDGIFIHNASGAGSDFDYVDVEYSDYGIYLNNTTAEVIIEHSNLRDNTIGFTSEYSSPFTIRYSDVTDNNYGMWINSRAGSNNINIKYVWVEENSNHGIYLQSGLSPYFGNCHLKDNNGSALYCYADVSPYLYGNKGYNHIYDNGQCGVYARENSYPKLGYSTNYGNNHIYNNADYHIDNENAGNMIAAVRNFWSSSLSECVIPPGNKFYGWVEYCPILPYGCPDCQTLNIESISDDLGVTGPDIPPGYELELLDKFEEAIEAYKIDIFSNPNSDDADFAIRGIVRCLDALNRYDEIVNTLDEFISKYENTRTAIAAKDVSMPFLVQQKNYQRAIERATELSTKTKQYPDKEHFYSLILADILNFRSNGKSGQDRTLSSMYYHSVANQSENKELAFWAQMKLRDMAGSGSGSIALHEQQDIKQAVPKTYGLQQNYPNPFNPITTIQYQLPEETTVSLIIYNMNGQIINKLVNHQVQPAGIYQAQWNATDMAGNAVSSGMYFYKLICNDFVDVKKMLLLR